MKKFCLLFIFVTTLFSLYSQEKTNKDAISLYYNGGYREAIAITEKQLETLSVDEATERMDSYSILMWSLIAIGNYDKAIRVGKEALSIYQDVRVIEALGEAYYYKGNFENALEYFRRYITLRPNGGSRLHLVHYFMGEIYINQEKFHLADISFTTAVYYGSQFTNWWVRLGYAREMTGDFDYAKEAYRKALEIEPNSSEAKAGIDRLS